MYYDEDGSSLASGVLSRRGRHALGRCPKCTGNLFFEADVVEGLLLRKCLQCGLIESYFWLERTTNTLVYLPPDSDPPAAEDAP